MIHATRSTTFDDISTELVGDFYLWGNAFKRLRSAIRDGHVGISVPEVVILEVVNKHREIARRAAREAAASVKEFGRVVRAPISIPFKTIAEKESHIYEEGLRGQLKGDLRAGVIPLPTVAHETLIRVPYRGANPSTKRERATVTR